MRYLVRSTSMFLLLYGLLAFAANQLYFGYELSSSLLMQVAIALLLLQYLLGPALIRLVMDIDWTEDLPVRNKLFLAELCAREKLPMPKIGIIHGALPNAFTFGRLQSDASIVVSDGLLETLTEDEVNAVVAHEVGHIKHWDFALITAAALVPLLLYQLHTIAGRLKDDHWAGYVAYAAYWLSEFLVLSLSRTREYWADNFAARATGNPALLGTALVKICYGMTRVKRTADWARRHGDEKDKVAANRETQLAGRIGVMGISAAESAFSLSNPSVQEAQRLMRWDLENPWARIYELSSTHPRTAKRIEALDRLAVHQARAAQYPVMKGIGIRWGKFPIEFALWSLPPVLGASMIVLGSLVHREVIALPPFTLGAMAAVFLFIWVARIRYRYQGNFEPARIEALLADSVPSQMLPRAVRIEGEIASRAEPESWFSSDLVIQDETGMLVAVNRQSIPLARFAMIPEANNLVGHRVVLEGWYRRGLAPMVEISSIRRSDGTVHSMRSYSRWVQVFYAVAGSGLLLFLVTR